MTYPFPPQLEALVRQQMQSGAFASEDDLLLEALRTLAWVREDLEAIGEGLSDAASGRVRPFEDFDREFRARNDIAGDDLLARY